MKTLHIDLETYSSVDLKKYGMHRYVESPDFEILLFAYAFDDDPVMVIDILQGERVPAEVEAALTDPEVIKKAFNAPFEIACLRRYGYKLNIHQWQCVAVHAAYLGLPRSLDEVCKVMKMSEDKAKKATGRALIRYFCMPCKPTKTNGHRTRNMPDLVKWPEFISYCANDVEAEREIERRLGSLPAPQSEWDLWVLDQEINNRGAKVDIPFVNKAIEIGDVMRAELLAEAMTLTGLNNPNSIEQLKKWLETEIDEEIETLRKDDVKALIKKTDDETVTRVLEIRQELGKTSLKKYQALAGATCSDSRIRGTLLFYGANRTGRWAGRVFQPQNLPQNHLDNLEDVRWMVEQHDYGTLSMLYESPADILSQLVRTAIIPKAGCKFIVADFSAVEARNIAWYADEEWRLEVFRTHGKIYEASASAAFHVPIEEITKASPLRQQGKVLELACGYGGGAGAVEKMDTKKAIPAEERKKLVKAWREASPNIVQFWWDMDSAAVQAVENPGKVFKVCKGVSFIREKGFLFMTLPSGRRLAYPRPRMEPDDKFNKMKLTYEGVDQYTRQWTRISTYGPKLVENLVQATCRDLLAYGMQQVAAAGYDIVLHVHDESITEVPMDVPVSEIERLLATLPPWAEGMPHKAEGFETMFYKK